MFVYVYTRVYYVYIYMPRTRLNLASSLLNQRPGQRGFDASALRLRRTGRRSETLAALTRALERRGRGQRGRWLFVFCVVCRDVFLGFAP